jgi:hypothetical protein
MVIAMRVYVGTVIAAGATLLLVLAPQELQSPEIAAGLLAAALALSVFKLRLPLGNGASTMSLACVADFVALMVEGAGLAMFLGAIGVLIQCTVRVRRRQPIHRAAFSAAAVVIAVQAAGLAWRALGGNVSEATLTTTVLPLAACALVYYLVNASLVVGAISVSAAVSPVRAWSPAFWWSAPAYVLSSFIATLVALALVNGVILLLPIVLWPLYVCYRAYQRRWTERALAIEPRGALAALHS